MNNKELMKILSEEARLTLLLKENEKLKKYMATIGKNLQQTIAKYSELEKVAPKMYAESSTKIKSLEDNLNKTFNRIDKSLQNMTRSSERSDSNFKTLETKTQNLMNSFVNSTKELSNEISIMKKVIETYSNKEPEHTEPLKGIERAYFDRGNLIFLYTDGTTDNLGKIASNQDSVYQIKKGGRGDAGVGIKEITRTSGDGSPGTTDTYTITYTDSSYTPITYNVYNGADGLAIVRNNLTTQSATDALSANQGFVLGLRTDLSASNMITNGDFSNGTTGWALSNVGVPVVASNEVTFTATASGAYIRQSSLTPATVVGHKYYAKSYVKSASNLVSIGFGASSKVHSGSGNYETLSLIHTATSTGHTCGVYDYRVSGWTETKFGYTLAIDLTATFGTGKEPSLAEMDSIMALYTNSWFNGTQNPLLTSKQIYNDKASKVQESWIAPTLGNSFVNFGGTDEIAGYMKDEFGFVHIRGKIKTGASGASPFTLAVGYRPPYDITLPIISNDVFGYCKITTAGVVTVYGNNTYYSISGITFKV